VVVSAESLFLLPARESRPKRIAIILRGLPGSGKSAAARKLRELELAHGGEAPRVLSLDDYFVTVGARIPCTACHCSFANCSKGGHGSGIKVFGGWQEVDKEVPDDKRKGKMRTIQELEYRYEPEMAGVWLCPTIHDSQSC
jgi:YLP motif-containing protein 1